jgi:ketosteroid isomerase-like protein
MSQENVELVKRWIDAWNRGERSLSEGEVDPDLVIESRFRPEPYSGVGGVEQWTREIDDQFQEWRIEMTNWRSKGNLVVALGQLHIRGRAGGVEFDQPAAAVVEVRDGKLLRLRLFADHAEALETAGLSE